MGEGEKARWVVCHVIYDFLTMVLDTRGAGMSQPSGCHVLEQSRVLAPPILIRLAGRPTGRLQSVDLFRMAFSGRVRVKDVGKDFPRKGERKSVDRNMNMGETYCANPDRAVYSITRVARRELIMSSNKYNQPPSPILFPSPPPPTTPSHSPPP